MSGLLEIKNLTVSFCVNVDKSRIKKDGFFATEEMTAVKAVNLCVEAGETLALVGESGCGKTVLCKAILQLLCEKARIKHGEICFEGENLLALAEKDMEKRRGGDIAMVFQDPMLSLNPTISVGKQIAEVLRLHRGLHRREAEAEACQLMAQVGIGEVKERYGQMPHEFSGGMRQRIAIAIALAGNPKLLLADEPTTALDVDTQQEILELLKEIQRQRHIAVIFITHDLSLVPQIAQRVAIMKDGCIVEMGNTAQIFSAPQGVYTKKLLGYLNYGKGSGHSHRLDSGLERGHRHNLGLGEGAFEDLSRRSEGALFSHPDQTEILQQGTLVYIRNLSKSFPLGGKTNMWALKDVNMEIYRGEVLGLIGPSGCGKSTLAKCIMGICTPTSGQILFADTRSEQGKGSSDGSEAGFRKNRSRDARWDNCSSAGWKQMIFQDSASAFNPRMTIEKIIGEPLRIKEGRTPNRNLILQLLEQVELLPDVMERYPYEISGGQRQRVAIARGISTDPTLIVADEPVSSLDISVQSQIVHLFRRLQEERRLTLLLIAHDLPMVYHVSDRIITLRACT